MNSLWGILFNLIKETSFTRKELMWGTAWINIQIMQADAPRFKKGKKVETLESVDDFKDFLNL